jgi:hypothetical protein
MSKPLVPCPVCPECGRILGAAQARFAELAGECAECVLDRAEDAVVSGKLTHTEEEARDAA